MLVLSRKTDQSIYIGDQIRITVVQVQGNRVKIGIEAPQSIKVYRSELVDAPREIGGPPPSSAQPWGPAPLCPVPFG